MIKNSHQQLKNGFTLIITISLLVLLILIGIGLLSLSAVTLRGSAQSNAQRIAKDNAKMAMIIAIGQLQKHAGVDTRITATADIAAGAAGITLAAGAAPLNNSSINGQNKGLTAVQNGSRFWTGVFTNRDTAASIHTKTPSPALLQWLVSGNETMQATLVGTAYTAHNGIVPSNSSITVGSSGSVSDPQKAVVLVGEASVGKAGVNTIGNYVSAPLVNIKDAAGKNNGRYAWWVGDDGAKAKLNILQSNTDNTQYASLTAQRRGWDSISGFSEYPSPTSAAHSSLTKLSTINQAELLMPAAANGSSGVSPLQAAFHSATVDSFGLLVDNLNGGTKVDLHTILSKQLPSTKPTTIPTTAVLNYPINNTTIIPKSVANSMVAPSWNTLQEFYTRGKNLSSGALIVKAATSSTQPSISPMITDFRILMGVKFVRTGSTFKTNPCGKIAIVISNPYSVPLRWDNDLEIEVRNDTPSGNSPSRIWNLGANCVYINRDTSEQAVFNNAFFSIGKSTLQPGEARAYTLAGYTRRLQGTGASRVVVPLTPFNSSAPFDFNRCVELESTRVFNSAAEVANISFDVRESQNTTQIIVDMKSAGSSSSESLCRIEDFELDNGFFGQNTRRFTESEVSQLTGPVGLMLYSFQISRPGMMYNDYMPATHEMGQRGSTLRTFYDFNMHGTRFYKSIASYNPAPFFMESSNGHADMPKDPPGGDTGTAFTRNLVSSQLPWARSLINSSPKTILFSTPRQFTSLAQFQHADLTGDEIAGSLGHQPAYAVGNSYANPFVKRSSTQQRRSDYRVLRVGGSSFTDRNYFDIAYLLNASLWDAYFLSALPESNSSIPSDNPTLLGAAPGTTAAELIDPITAATKLMVDGAFNINSTDKNAWKAFLGSSKHFRHKADTTTSPGAAFPRTLEQITASTNPPTGNDADSFSGYRRLTDTELDALATEIVKQVRLRGPFLSHSHFVNRAIGNITSNTALTRSGALQSAIDESGINVNIAGNKKSFSKVDATADRVNLLEKNGAPRADLDGTDLAGQLQNADPSVPDWANSSQDNHFGAVASIIADREMLSSLKNEQGFRSTAIPSWLTQADVLQVIGPSISPRSDTFRIRSFGEALDTNGKSIAKAYCEAIIQRMPHYVDPTNKPEIRDTLTEKKLTTLNRTYGRQFKIVSFRWLSAQEV